MNSLTRYFDVLTRQFVEWVIRFRWWVALASVLLSVLLASGVVKTEFNASYKYFFEANNPDLAAFNELENTFTRLDTSILAIKPENDSIASTRMMALAYEITERLWEAPFTTRVDSITNYQHTYADGDDVYVTSFIDDPSELTDERVQEIFRIAETKPELHRRIYSLENNTLAFIARANIEPGDNDAFKEAALYVYQLREELQKNYPDVRMAITGLVPRGYLFNQVSIDDMSLLIPVMMLLIVVVIWFLTRSLLCALIAIVLVTLSSGAAMGVGALLGIPISSISASAPIIILTVAVADAIHILVNYLIELGRNKSGPEAILKSMHLNAKPVLLTSVTTAIGFLSLNFSTSPPYRDLGNLAAIGVFFAWFLSMTFLPAALACVRIKPKLFVGKQSSLIAVITRFIMDYKNRLFAGVMLVTLVFLTFLPRLEFNDDYFKYFDRRIDSDADSRFIQDNLSGLYTLHYLIPSGAPDGITEPHYLNHLEKLVTWMRQQPEVLNVYAVNDVFKNLNQNMHGDDPSYNAVAQSRELNAQYLLLYQMSLPYGLDIRDQINIDKSATRLDVSLTSVKTQELIALSDRLDAWIRKNMPPEMQATATGSALLFSTVGVHNFESMKPSTLGAFILISVLIGVSLGSVALGIVSILPNTIPIVIAGGLFALTGSDLGVWTPFVISTALGLIVDATVHILSKFNHARVYDNLDVDSSIVYAFSTVGVALLVSTLVLVLGFSTLGYAIVNNLKYIGLGTALIIVLAIIVDGMILPALLSHTARLQSWFKGRPGGV